MSGIEKAFELSVVISAIDKLTSPMKAMEGAMKYTQGRMDTVTKSMKAMGSTSKEIDQLRTSLDKLARAKEFGHIADDLKQIGATEAQIQEVAKGMEKVAAAQEKMSKLKGQMGGFAATTAVGGAVTMGGISMADKIKQMLEVAGEFQTKLTVIQDITGESNKAMEKLGDTVMSTSAKVSKFNDMQVAGFAQQLASGGFPKTEGINQLLLPVSQYAEVQMYEGKQSNPEESVKQAIEMAHLFKHYDAPGLTNFLDTFNKYSVMQPGDTTSLEQTLTYLAPVAFRQLHMKEDDVMKLAAIDNRIGLTGSHGGTNSADMILRLIPGLVGGMPTKKKTPAAWQAAVDLGLLDSKTGESKFFKNGELVNLDQLLGTLTDSMKGRSSLEITKDFKEMLGIQGGRAGGILGDESTIEQIRSIVEQTKATKSMSQIQEDIRATPQGQMDALKSNSMTLMLRVANQLGYALNPLLEKMNALLEKTLAFSQAHPKVAKYVGTFMLMATGFMLIAGPLTSVIGLLGMFGTGLRMLFVAKEIGGISLFGRMVMRLGMNFMGAQKLIIRFLGVFDRMGLALAKILAQATIWAVRMAAQWLIAMGPIGWIIMGVIAVVALLVVAWRNNWGHIQEHTKAAVDWIGKHLDTILMFMGPAGWLIMGIIKTVQLVRQHWDEIVNYFKTHDWKQIGSDVVNGIWKGIESMGTWMETNITKWVDDNIPGPIKKFLGIASPSKLMMEHGKYVAQGLALGMTNNAGLVGKASLGLSGQVSGGMDAALALSPQGAGSGGVMIVINPHPHQRVEEIAEAVIQKMGSSARRMNMNMGISLNPGAV